MTMKSKLTDLTHKFVDEVASIVQETLLAATGASPLPAGMAYASTPAAKRAKKSTAKRSVKEIVAKLPRSKKAKRTKRGPGEKRTPEQMEATKAQILAYIKDHPGEGIESIGKGLKKATSELSLPLKKLIAEKAVSTKGKKRAMKYTAKGG